MEAFVDEKAVRVENVFLDFLKKRYEQEDAHEFLQCLLDKLDSCSIVDVSAKDEESASYVQDSSLVNKIFGGRVQSKRSADLPRSSFVRDQNAMNTFEQHVAESERKANVSMSSWRSIGHGLRSKSNILQPSSLVESHTINMNGAQHKNSLFSSSLSELFHKKLLVSRSFIGFGVESYYHTGFGVLWPQQYGDIRGLYTSCKHCGFVMIAYFDIRAARNAMRALQNKPLRRKKLDIHYSIPKDTRELDLQDLFNTFGHVSRVYIAYDHKTGISRGFGFVNFVHKDDAKNAIAKLNGYGYDNLILRVEWVRQEQTWIVNVTTSHLKLGPILTSCASLMCRVALIH
ncbi:hypothetical protein IFM89_013180 [Coptis chinensis]|uniref:RRM domain-containing protein n=1 Tax=Coptis chinensis TaxID=261450 RepID=A0A835IDS8_9MAGN|nr:hypothetical protein IFM89_013180 [Coptis chinensis]